MITTEVALLIFGAIMLMFLLGTLVWAQVFNPHFDLTEAFQDPRTKRVAFKEIALFVALITSTFLLVYDAVLKQLGTEEYALYMLTWAGTKVLLDKIKTPPLPKS